jgi:hypothetical protein
MGKTRRQYPSMPRMKKPRYQKPRIRNPYGGGNRGGNPMNSMVKTIGQTTMGVVGIGAMTTLGMGALNAIKPK